MATKKSNADRKKFNIVLENLNHKLKKSQISNAIAKRTLTRDELEEENSSISKKMSDKRFGYLFGKRRDEYLKLVNK